MISLDEVGSLLKYMHTVKILGVMVLCKCYSNTYMNLVNRIYD